MVNANQLPPAPIVTSSRIFYGVCSEWAGVPPTVRHDLPIGARHSDWEPPHGTEVDISTDFQTQDTGAEPQSLVLVQHKDGREIVRGEQVNS